MATVVGASGYSSQQPAQYDPAMQNVVKPVRSWATTGTSDTVYDATVHVNSAILLTPTSGTPAGFWQVVVSQGQFVVTSSASETAGLTYTYRVL